MKNWKENNMVATTPEFEELKKTFPWLTFPGYITASKISRKLKIPIKEYIVHEDIEAKKEKK